MLMLLLLRLLLLLLMLLLVLLPLLFLMCLAVHKHIRTSLATTIAASEPTSLTTHAVASGPPLESINYMPIGCKMLAVLRPMAV